MLGVPWRRRQPELVHEVRLASGTRWPHLNEERWMRRQPTAAELRLLEQLDESEVVELLRDLIQCRSDNPPGQELACAEAIQRYLSANGISGRLVEALPGRPNAIAYVEFGSGPTLALNGHMDTVPPGSG